MSDGVNLKEKFQDRMILFCRDVTLIGNNEIDKNRVIIKFGEIINQILQQDNMQIIWKDQAGQIFAYNAEKFMFKVGDFSSIWPIPEKNIAFEHVPLSMATFSSRHDVRGLEIYNTQHDSLSILAKNPSSEELWNLFETDVYISQLIFFNLAAQMQAVQKTSELGIDNELTKLERLLEQPQVKVSNYLNKVVSIFNKYGNVLTSDHFGKILRFLLQKFLGTGWTDRLINQEDRSSVNKKSKEENALLIETYSKIDDFLNITNSSTINDDERSENRLLAHCLRVLAIKYNSEKVKMVFSEYVDVLSEKRTLSQNILSVFTKWVFLHEYYRTITDFKPPSRRAVYLEKFYWNNTTKETCSVLKSFLSSFALVPEKDRNFKSITVLKNFLHLWFLYQLLLCKDKIERHEKDLDTFRAELAFAIRETLRYASYGESPGFSLHDHTYIASLRSLLEYHAHDIIGLPLEFDLRRFLDEITEVKNLKKLQSPIQYLHHVADVYLTGHCLMDVKYKFSNNTKILQRKIADLITSPTGFETQEKTICIFKQAFSLAALFHDISHLVFPFEEGAGRKVLYNSWFKNSDFEDVEKTLYRAGADIATRCINDLEEGKYFDLKREKNLKKWLDLQRNSGEPDHGLLSAWYLHHICHKAYESHFDVLRMAVRATMLHNALTVPIEAEVDPTVAYLTFCNELYEWESSRGDEFSKTILRQKLILGSTGGASNKPPFQWIHVDGLTFEEDLPQENGPQKEEQPIIGQLNVNSSGFWPTVRVNLKAPENLDIPIFSLCLIKAQRLARIKPAERTGWRFTMVLEGATPPPRLQKHFKMKEFMETLIYRSRLPIRPALIRWLREGNPFREEFGDNTVVLGPLEGEFFHQDIRGWLPALEKEAMELIYHLT